MEQIAELLKESKSLQQKGRDDEFREHYGNRPIGDYATNSSFQEFKLLAYKATA